MLRNGGFPSRHVQERVHGLSGAVWSDRSTPQRLLQTGFELQVCGSIALPYPPVQTPFSRLPRGLSAHLGSLQLLVDSSDLLAVLLPGIARLMELLQVIQVALGYPLPMVSILIGTVGTRRACTQTAALVYMESGLWLVRLRV